MRKLYQVVEVFYSIQGEGINAGKPAVFIRFAGCDEACPFCDEGNLKGKGYTCEELFKTVEKVMPEKFINQGYPLIVLTGGEPTLHNLVPIVNRLHKVFPRIQIAIETNGNNYVPEEIDFVTCSPKQDWNAKATFFQNPPDEWKFLIKEDGEMLVPVENFESLAGKRFIQPLWGSPSAMQHAIDYCKANPQFSLSVQLHKYIGVE